MGLKSQLIFVANWITSALQLEENIVPLIDAAHRLGPPRKAKNTTPRDILVRFADMRSRQRLLLEACTKDFLMHGTSKILVFSDLSAETLEARHRLRPVTMLLSKHNHHYRWVVYAKILVQHKGASYMATDIDSGAKLLSDLGVTLPPDFPSPVPGAEHPVWKSVK